MPNLILQGTLFL